MRSVSAVAVVAVSLLVAFGVAWAGGSHAATWLAVRLTVWCAALAFIVQWVAFVPAYAKQTERFYDLTGSLTYIGVTLFAVIASGSTDARSVVLATLVLIWAGRLGSFLFRRIRQEGSDARFDRIKPSAPRFLSAWTLQGLWVFLTLCAALAAITASEPAPLGVRDAVGVMI